MEFTEHKSDVVMKQEMARLAGKMEHRILTIWAADCAEHVLFYFEEEYPEDDRPRKAIEAARAWVQNEISVSAARSAAFSAHAAAREVAGHAVHASNYAAASSPKERIWQYHHLLLLKGEL